MGHLEDVSVADLQRALERVEGKRATQRLITAIAYKHGVTQTELATWYGVQRRTIYNWLSRFDDRPIEAAVSDAERPGRPRKLDPTQRAALYAALRDPPTAVGLGEERWTAGVVRDYVADRFGVTYSVSTCRRLLREADGDDAADGSGVSVDDRDG
jgi:transposase